MGTSYSVTIASNTGQFLTELMPVAGEYTLAERSVTMLSLTLPPTVPINFLQKDGRIQVRRAVDGAPPQVDGNATWLIRRRQQVLQGRERLIKVWAVHANDLLRRRIVAYAAGSSQAAKAGAADDVIKAIVRENFITPTDAARAWSGLTVQADASAGPSIDKAFSRQNVLKVLQAICDTSSALGTYLGFEVRTFGASLVLLTYVGQRGTDRRIGTSNYIRVSPASGAISESSLDEDWTDEITYMYSLGQGLEADRQIGTAQNADAESLSPFGRIEGGYQANQATTQAQLDDEAASALYDQRARVNYEARAQEAPGFRYGLNYSWGDLLTVTDFGANFAVRVNPVRVRFDRSGEQIDTRFTSNDVGLAV